MGSAPQDPGKYGFSVSNAFSVVFVSYRMCMCHDFFNVCFQSRVYLAPRKRKPAQIRLNPESSCLSVEYFTSKHVFTSLHSLYGKLICHWSSRKLPPRLTLYTIPPLFNIIWVCLLVSRVTHLTLVNHQNVVSYLPT